MLIWKDKGMYNVASRLVFHIPVSIRIIVKYRNSALNNQWRVLIFNLKTSI